MAAPAAGAQADRAAERPSRADAFDPAPIGRGGQAEVFRARHKLSRVIVAIKRLHPANVNAVVRMRREIGAAQAFGGSPHVMPVLDFSNQRDWFLLPLADHNATAILPAPSDATALRDLVAAMTCRRWAVPTRPGTFG